MTWAPRWGREHVVKKSKLSQHPSCDQGRVAHARHGERQFEVAGQLAAAAPCGTPASLKPDERMATPVRPIPQARSGRFSPFPPPSLPRRWSVELPGPGGMRGWRWNQFGNSSACSRARVGVSPIDTSATTSPRRGLRAE